MQELALLTTIRQQQEEEAALEEARFRSMIIAMHPTKAKEILEVLDKPDEGEFAEELSDEEMQNYDPYSVEEAQAAIDMLRNFGVAVQ